MRKTDALLALAACACMAACSPGKQDTSSPVPDTAINDTAPATVADPATPAAKPPEVRDDPVKPPTAAEARQVVIDYYAALNAKDYPKAYALWSDEGAASGQSFALFSGGYANTESVEAEVGQATDEQGAAGSRYISVPVQLRAPQYKGSVRNYRGRFALRAVVADGASEQQRRWHLDSAEMQRMP